MSLFSLNRELTEEAIQSLSNVDSNPKIAFLCLKNRFSGSASIWR